MNVSSSRRGSHWLFRATPVGTSGRASGCFQKSDTWPFTFEFVSGERSAEFCNDGFTSSGRDSHPFLQIAFTSVAASLQQSSPHHELFALVAR